MIGESIGSYRIVAKLGEGGMGAVYLGEHRRIARKAAIKVLLPALSTQQELVDRFFTEARATSLIRHPGIVEIIDCDVLPAGNAYIVMELLEGESLGSHLRRGARFTLRRTLSLVRHVADALQAAHERGIVHRDLKPDNVFVLAKGDGVEGQPIKIVDFGIAKLMSSAHDGNYQTRPGSLLGTPVYMSPEQCRGRGEIDPRSDIYSLGCVLFEMLCGVPPFAKKGFGELIQAHLSAAPPALRSIDSTFSPALEGLVARMLAKSPDERPQTMRALCAELDAIPALAPPAAARNIGNTVAFDSAPAAASKVETTLRAASAEMLAFSDGPGAGAARFRRTSRILAAAGLAALMGGVVIWRTGIASRTTVPPIDPKPFLVVPVTPTPTPTPAPAPTPPVPPVPSALLSVSSPSAAQKVKVVISSNPTAAEVCLATNRILLGRTRLEWTVKKSPRTVMLLIRKPGYRGQEIAVALKGDAKMEATLEKLGPDDMDDALNCKPK